jgi:hypothetical protein
LSVNYNEISTTNSQCTGSCNFLFHRKHARSNYSSLRNTYNADIVVLLVGDTTSCGVAYTQRDQCGIDTDELNCSVGAGYNAFAYSVVSSNPACPVGDYSFVHEVGHQFGLEHDRTEPYTEDPSFYWSFGYAIYAPPIADRDVMARASNCLGCASTLLYSTPQVNFPSGATAGTFNIDGNGRAAWNARTVAALASTMSGFRGAAVTDRVFRSAFEDLPLP